MKKLKDDIQQIGANYINLESRFIFDSLLQNNISAEAYEDEDKSSTITMLWDKEQCAYFGGHSPNKGSYSGAVRYLIQNILDEDTRDRLSMIKIYYETEDWEAILLEELKNFNAKIYWRSLYAHDFQSIPKVLENYKGINIRAMDEELLYNSKLANVHYLREELEKRWYSMDRFLEKGFGYYASRDGEILGWCTAEYLSDKCCGIGIETVQEFKRQGVASILSEMFLRKCREKGLVPYWDTWKSNVSSLSCAKKMEFHKVRDYKVVLALL